MLRGLLLFLALGMSLPAPPAQAGEAPGRFPELERCTGDSPEVATTAGMLSCAGSARAAAEQRVARLLRDAAGPGGQLDPARLHAAQQNWRRYRDSHCGLFDPGGPRGGTQARVGVALCSLRETLRREEELKALIEAMRPL